MNKRLDYLFDGIAIFLGSIQPEEVLKWIQLVLGIIATIVSIAISLWTWYKKSSADGKITKDEINEGIDIATNGIKELEDKLGDKEKEKKDQ